MSLLLWTKILQTSLVEAHPQSILDVALPEILQPKAICFMLPKVLFLLGLDNCKSLRKHKCQVELLLSSLMKLMLCQRYTFMKNAYVCMYGTWQAQNF